MRPAFSFPSLNALSAVVTGLCWLAVASTDVLAADASGTKNRGAWVNLPKDGTPWRHPGTGLIFPQSMGNCSLNGGYLDKVADHSVAVTYSHSKLPLKADVIITPCHEDLVKTPDVMKVARTDLEKLAADLLGLSKGKGYTELQRSPINEARIPLWEKSEIPFVSQTIELVPAADLDSKLPPLNQWLAVLIYQDHFIQINVVLPSDAVKESRAETDTLITNIIQCLRYPVLKPQMLEVCRTYAGVPLTEDGRKAADALITFSKESPVFEVIMPGEALTPMLNTINEKSQDAALDLLRAFIVGSAVVTLQNGTADESLEEGALLMVLVRDLLKEKKMPVESQFLDELEKAVKQKRAAAFLRQRMNGTSTDK